MSSTRVLNHKALSEMASNDVASYCPPRQPTRLNRGALSYMASYDVASYCQPRHPTHFVNQCLEFNGFLRRGEQYLQGRV
jgi:hypothetical protein